MASQTVIVGLGNGTRTTKVVVESRGGNMSTADARKVAAGLTGGKPLGNYSNGSKK